MAGKLDASKVPRWMGQKAASHKRGEFRRSVKPANSAGRHVRQCEVQSRFMGDSKANGHWSSNIGYYTDRYLTRDGAGIDGEKPTFFTVDENGKVVPGDSKAFVKEAENDKYLLMLVIPPNDGEKIKDFEGFTAAVVTKMESDLDTKLTWIAVVHEKHDRAHPEGGPKNKHSHVLIRGADEDGNRLWISREYLSSTLRDVVQKELSAHPTNERENGWRLGPMSDQEAAAFQKQMADNRPDRIAKGWTKPNELEREQMQREQARTASVDRDSPAKEETKERKRDRSRGAGMED